ncbi:MAG: histone-like nucleoid-structuring protein Lsr2 [Pseudonocardiaceae bacterium]
MAKKTVVTLIDDLTGEQAENIRTVEFALDGVSYEIDLADDNEARLRDELASYITAARKTGGRRGGARRAGRPAGSSNNAGSGYNRDTLKAIREWAKQNGHEVSDRGRLPADVVKAWEEQHQGARDSGRAPAFSG